MNEHKRAILAAFDGGASTAVTKAALAAVDALTGPLVIEVTTENGRTVGVSVGVTHHDTVSITIREIGGALKVECAPGGRAELT